MSVSQLNRVRRRAKQFCQINNMYQLEMLLDFPRHKLQLLCANPPYKYFTIKKKNGSNRNIETPEEPLMRILKKLNSYLQSVYFLNKTAAAYGFIINLKRVGDKRNILTNANRHLNNEYLLNIDLKDFFHQVKEADVFKIFTKAPFDFDYELALLFTKLTTNLGRLPMGTPTSPVLSNFAFMNADNKLTDWAKANEIVYTRFADDLAFSGKKRIVTEHYQQIDEILKDNNFLVNPNKVKFYDKDDPKEVTGLLLGQNGVLLPESYFGELDDWIKKLDSVMQIKFQGGSFNHREEWLKKFFKQIEGKLAFMEMVYKKDEEKLSKWQKKYEEALMPPEDLPLFESMNWSEFPYNL